MAGLTPRVVDNDRDEITVTLDGKEIRGWSYRDEAERRVKMLAAREFCEGWFQREKMHRQKQAFRHDPANGTQGDCYRAAVACVLGVERDTVPHSHDDQTGEEAAAFMDAWLLPQGLRRIFIPVLGDDFKEVANAIYPRGGGLPMILTGRGPRDVNHVIVVHGVNDFWCPTLGEVDAEVALIGPALPDGYFWAEWIVRDPLVDAEDYHDNAAEAAYLAHQQALMESGWADDTAYRRDMVAAGRGHLVTGGR